jgi:CDP-glucose 4,6-dehydratase
LSGYLALAEKLTTEGPAYAEGWNFGPADEDARPVQWIVEQLTHQWGQGASWQLNSNPQPHEAHHLKLDCSKARARLGWQPRWNLPTALESITRWHKQWLAGDKMQTVSLQQIAEYQSRDINP